MKAARFHGPGDIRIDDVPEPSVGPGQVKVDVEWCGICGTDLHEYLEGPIFIPPKGSPHPLTGQEMPVVMGHEFAGVISEVGAGVTNVKEGDRVAVEPYDVCGECSRLRDRPLQHLPQAGVRRPRRRSRAGSPRSASSTPAGPTRSATSRPTSARSSSRWPSPTTRCGSRGSSRAAPRRCSAPARSGWSPRRR